MKTALKVTIVATNETYRVWVRYEPTCPGYGGEILFVGVFDDMRDVNRKLATIL